MADGTQAVLASQRIAAAATDTLIAHMEGKQAERIAKGENLLKLEAFVRTCRANSGGMPDPARYLRANSAKLMAMFNQACVDDGECPPHLTGIQASDFAIAIAELDAAADRWAAKQSAVALKLGEG